MNLPIGWLIALASALAGFFLLGGKPGQLWVPEELLIVVGAAIGSLVAANKSRNLKGIYVAISHIFIRASAGREANLALLCMMFDVLQKIKREGPIAIEKDVASPDTSPLFSKYSAVIANSRLMEFITDYLRMLIDGSITVSQLDSIMRQEIDVLNQESHDPAASLYVVADSLPAFGIVAAIVGVIKALTSVGTSNPATIGVALSAALTGTLLGVFLSYAIAQPIARTLEQLADSEVRPFEAVKEILIAHYSDFSPLVAVEYGRKVLFSDQRPSMLELESGIQSSVKP